MARPLTRAQALQNRAFLKLLRKTGNVRLACRELGLSYGTMQHRRRGHPAFALRWDAAMVFAQAKFAKSGRRGPSTASGPPPREISERMNAFRTSGGEMFNAFNRRRRADPAFAAHMAAALDTARAVLELQLCEATGAFDAPADDDSDWSGPEHPGPFDRRLTVDEAINLLGKLNKRYG